jgi:uncharacterized protein YndB with AHSA1/START domain
MNRSADPELDLTISRVIAAPRSAVWNGWADRNRFEQWWVPAPAQCRVDEMELAPGGAFETRICESDGVFRPHMSGCFLAVDPAERIVFTTCLTGGWRPAEQPFITAIITFADHPDGTRVDAYVMHKNEADRAMHDEAGFFDGWGTCLSQLAAIAERGA